MNQKTTELTAKQALSKFRDLILKQCNATFPEEQLDVIWQRCFQQVTHLINDIPTRREFFALVRLDVKCLSYAFGAAKHYGLTKYFRSDFVDRLDKFKMEKRLWRELDRQHNLDLLEREVERYVKNYY